MTTPEHVPFDMGQLLELFPGDAVLVARLLVESDAFRNVCEDLALARSTLVKLETFRIQQELSKIAEYRQLVADLESEVAEALEHAKRSK